MHPSTPGRTGPPSALSSVSPAQHPHRPVAETAPPSNTTSSPSENHPSAGPNHHGPRSDQDTSALHRPMHAYAAHHEQHHTSGHPHLSFRSPSPYPPSYHAMSYSHSPNHPSVIGTHPLYARQPSAHWYPHPTHSMSAIPGPFHSAHLSSHPRARLPPQAFIPPMEPPAPGYRFCRCNLCRKFPAGGDWLSKSAYYKHSSKYGYPAGECTIVPYGKRSSGSASQSQTSESGISAPESTQSDAEGSQPISSSFNRRTRDDQPADQPRRKKAKHQPGPSRQPSPPTVPLVSRGHNPANSAVTVIDLDPEQHHGLCSA
ncbi:uncharacterized protein BJ171DRAFT_487465 [Polychytrium aggregatum]|uniref:uncharacterized protein n=1 Tax=Polychytrium aggregatum TaxID=110093 RepID=UPI0022FE5106|nr:uncharacterized protein BJ171DRAFT_487465 [Polychytrium aggregatum]KAI9208834.1 hypothetical protein BJ171DRAFT_487465 [Polychytrium aggregatum]